jgi:hypothetical protein
VIGLVMAQLYLGANVSRRALFIAYAVLAGSVFIAIYFMWRVHEHKLRPSADASVTKGEVVATIDVNSNGDAHKVESILELQSPRTAIPQVALFKAVAAGEESLPLTPSHEIGGSGDEIKKEDFVAPSIPGHWSDMTAAAHQIVHFHHDITPIHGHGGIRNGDGHDTPILHDDHHNGVVTKDINGHQNGLSNGNGVHHTALTIDTKAHVRFSDQSLSKQVCTCSLLSVSSLSTIVFVIFEIVMVIAFPNINSMGML